MWVDCVQPDGCQMASVVMGMKYHCVYVVTICSTFMDIHWMRFVLSVCAVCECCTLLYIFSLVGSRAQAKLHQKLSICMA